MKEEQSETESDKPTADSHERLKRTDFIWQYGNWNSVSAARSKLGEPGMWGEGAPACGRLHRLKGASTKHAQFWLPASKTRWMLRAIRLKWMIWFLLFTSTCGTRAAMPQTFWRKSLKRWAACNLFALSVSCCNVWRTYTMVLPEHVGQSHCSGFSVSLLKFFSSLDWTATFRWADTARRLCRTFSACCVILLVP